MNQLLISEYQKLFFLEWALAPEDSTYNVSLVYKIIGSLDKSILRKSCENFIKEHEIVHARYNSDGSECYYGNYTIDDFYHKLYLNSDNDINSQIREILDKPFNLTKDVLLRFYLLEHPVNLNEYYFIQNSHHIIQDAIHQACFVKQISDTYRQLSLTGNVLSIEQTSTNNSFNKAVQAENQVLTIDYKHNAQKYWLNFLNDITLNTELPYKSEVTLKDLDNKLADKTGAFVYFELDENERRFLREYAKKNKSTVFIVLSAIYGFLISKYSNQNRVLLNYPVNMRSKGYSNVTGCFVNNLPLKILLEGSSTLEDLILDLTRQKVEIRNYQGYPLTSIIADQRQQNSVKVINHFNVGFAQTNLNTLPLELYGVKTQALDIPWSSNVFNEFGLRYDDSSKNKIKFKLEYRTALFDKKLITSFIASFKLLVTRLANQYPVYLKDYCPLDLAEYQQIIYGWNQTDKKYSDNKTIHQMFEEQVLRTPDNIAVIYENSHLTYRELNQKANSMAHYLRDTYQIVGDDLVAVCIDRSIDMLVTIMAILKAGAGYVPMDSNYPEERIAYILSDTYAKVILTKTTFAAKLIDIINTNKLQTNLEVTNSDNFKSVLEGYSKVNPAKLITSINLAYVIYTSGTTGKPKGVALQHQGIINRIQWMNNEYPLSTTDKILQKTPYVFDVSVWELFWASWYGASIIFARPDDHKDADYLIELIQKEQISVIHFVPSMLDVFNHTLSSTTSNSKLTSLRYMFCSGEALQISQAKQVHKLLPHIKLHNLYGPTEASVDVLYYDCSDKALEHVYIGKPINNTTAYVLDHNLIPLPIGAVGELYIGGVGLARGYLNLPELTTERFIVNPFQSDAAKQTGQNSILYKTGDLVRYLSDGNIEYIGRNDFQVKIRGFRIELSEIESKLVDYNEIKQAVVLVKEYGAGNENKYLVGYYVSDHELDSAIVLDYLHEQLPEYMVPSILIWLAKLPVTSNGKLDRKALPDAKFTTSSNYVKPRNNVEQEVCALYAEVLGLSVSKVGVHDDFFRLGGDSIIAIRLVSKINNSLNCSIRVKNVFQLKTVERLSKFIINENQQNKLPSFKKYSKFSLLSGEQLATINFAEIDDSYPASYLQIGMLLESDLDEHGAYHDVFAYKLNSTFIHDKFVTVWNQLIAKHELLRARFITAFDGYDIEIARNLTKDYQLLNDYSMESLVTAERGKRFDFAEFGLFRLIVNKLTDGFYLVFSFHHAIADGWSIASLINEFVQIYVYDQPANSELPAISYGEFVQIEQNAINDSNNVKFWKTYLQDVELPTLKWNFTGARSKDGLFYSNYQLNNNQAIKVLQRAQELSISVDSIFLHAYLKTLAQFLNYDDITLGLVVNNRLEAEGGDRLFGLFLNTIPFRLNIKRLLTENVFKEKVKLYEYKHMPYAKIKNLIGHNIHQFSYNFVNFHILKESQDEVTNSKDSFERSNIPCVLNILQHGEASFSINFIVHDNFIDDDYLKYLTQYLVYNLDLILSDEEPSNCLSVTDYHRIIMQWNHTTRSYPENKTIHQLFEKQVQKTPNNIAVAINTQFKDEGKSGGNAGITYQELNGKANQLAHYLRNAYQIKGDDLIALCLDRSEHMLIAILAVLKAGGAYVPIDSRYPEERIAYILKDTKAKVVLTSEIFQDQLAIIISRSKLKIEVEPINSIKFQDLINAYPEINPIPQCTSSNLAYVIYTSGTTGQPKGVMIEHSGVINLIYDLSERYSILQSDRVLLFANYVFDASVEQILLSLFNGSMLYICDNVIWHNIDLFTEYCITNKITHLHLTPSYAQNIEFKKINSLKRLILGGDYVSLSLFNKLYSPSYDLINEYGPTETTVTSILGFNLSNIGKPISNLKTYILSPDINPVPVGVVGELYIGGAGLVRGYLNLPGLTAERFIINPFQRETDKLTGKNAKLYKTGDLVRYLPDGNIEYLGRNDFQVKIRGFRIELSEIESKLISYPGINQAIVLVREHGGSSESKYLVAYYVASQPLDHDEIIAYLCRYLPEYMVPGLLVYLDKLPLTLNGKLDRDALPNPEFVPDNNYVAPRNDLEQQICMLYSKVLGLPINKVGIKSDFFRLGGDSILSIHISSQLRKSGINCAVKDIFTYRIVEDLAKHMAENITGTVMLKTEQGILGGSFGLLPIQQWFFDKVKSNQFKHYWHWNQSFMIKVPELNIEKLKRAILELVKYHDILRVTYEHTDNAWQQSYNELLLPELKMFDIHQYEAKEIQQILTAWQSEFDIEHGPLFQIGYISGYSDGGARVYFALHHLIVDAVSWRILTNDIYALYEGNPLSDKGSSYRQWVDTVNKYPLNHKDELGYWQAVLNSLPDYQTDKLHKPSNFKIELSKTTTQQLLQQANQAYNTEINDLLLTSLTYALRDWQGSAIQGITLEGHGREPIDAAIYHSNTVGWFTTMYPVKLELQETIGESIKYIKGSLRLIPNKGLGYGSFSNLATADDITFDKLPPISFNYLGQFDNSGGNWQITIEDSGISMNPDNYDNNLININGWIINGQLIFNVVTQLGDEITQLIAEGLRQHLMIITAHCVEKTRDGDQENTPSDFADFVPFEIVNADIDINPLFIFPPGHGGAESYYNNLVLKLNNKKLVLFNNFYHHMHHNKILQNKLTFEALAKYYILQLRKIQPKGPYNLLGWSFGGVLAFDEITRQLKQSGAEVRQLILLDSFFKYKEAIDHIFVEKQIPMIYHNNINYKYTPDIADLFAGTDIIPNSQNKLTNNCRRNYS